MSTALDNEPNAEATDFAYVESLLVMGRDLGERLAGVLEQERTALVQRDIEKLRAVLQEKDQIVALLGRIERSQDNLGGLDSAALTQAHFTAEQLERLKQLQHEVRRQISACRDQNHVNGRLVQRARQSVNEVLQVITGTAPAETYSSQGTSAGVSAGRIIGKA